MKLRNPDVRLELWIAEDVIVKNLSSVRAAFSTLRSTTFVAITQRMSASVNIGMFRSYLSPIPPDSVGLAHPVSLVSVEHSLGNPPVGSHLISPRTFYIHHGIYLGNGRIAHYGGCSGPLNSSSIEVTDLEHFAKGKTIWILQEQSEYSSDEVVVRACSRIGECYYRVLSNNCEHFCNWCTRGKSYSAQVNALLRSPRRFFSMVSALDPCFFA
jgi:hypothetical protein